MVCCFLLSVVVFVCGDHCVGDRLFYRAWLTLFCPPVVARAIAYIFPPKHTIHTRWPQPTRGKPTAVALPPDFVLLVNAYVIVKWHLVLKIKHVCTVIVTIFLANKLSNILYIIYYILYT